MMPVGSVLVEMEIEGEGNATAETVAAAPAPSFEPAPAAAVKPAPVPVEAAPAFTTRAVGNPPLAAPATRRRAHELGIPLHFVPGTGSGGRQIGRAHVCT